MNKSNAIFFILFLGIPSQLRSQALGRISGVVTAEEGALPIGTVVTIHKMPEYVQVRKHPIERFDVVRPTIRPPQTVPVTSTGTFDVAGLPSGRYKLCATPPDGYLDSCLWGAAVDVALPPGSSSSGRIIRVRRGAVVRIRVDDQQSLLAATETAIGGRHVLVGVKTPARAFREAILRSRDATGRNLTMTVPFDLPLRLWVNPVRVSVRAPDGRAITQAGQAANFQVSRLTGTVDFRLQVTQ